MLLVIKLKIGFEQLEDILVVGEARAAQRNEKFKVYLLREKPIEEKLDYGSPYRGLGFYIQFRPEKEMVTRGLFDVEADESEIFDYWQTKEEGELWKKGELIVGFMELLKERRDEVENVGFILKVDGKTYASWEPFAKDFGITELVPIATKVPKALAIKLQKITEEEGETPSWRIRLLIQEYLQEQIRDRVRRVMFEE